MENYAVPLLMLKQLREATRASHEDLDAAFGALDLADRGEYGRFLTAHYIAVAPLYPAFRDFCAAELDVAAPDFPGMLRDDLAEIGLDASALPVLAAPVTLDPAEVTYVLAGSRLGIAAIRKHDYWGRSHATACRYMEDTDGLAVWRGLTAWMRGRPCVSPAPEPRGASALTAFALFREAFAASAPAIAR